MSHDCTEEADKSHGIAKSVTDFNPDDNVRHEFQFGIHRKDLISVEDHRKVS